MLHGVAKHDMAEAIEHVVSGISEVREELQQAFLARDKGFTGALGGPDFKASGSAICPHFWRSVTRMDTCYLGGQEGYATAYLFLPRFMLRC